MLVASKSIAHLSVFQMNSYSTFYHEFLGLLGASAMVVVFDYLYVLSIIYYCFKKHNWVESALQIKYQAKLYGWLVCSGLFHRN